MIASGEALRALERLVEAQGGDPRLAERPVGGARVRAGGGGVPAPRAGSVARCGALAIGRAAMRLGAGRERKEDAIDHAVGIVVHVKPGDVVERGEPLAHVHARDTRRPSAPSPRCSPPTSSSTAPSSARRCCSRRSAEVPELPEVETVRRRLLPHLTGRTLREVEILDFRLTDPEPPEAVAARLRASRIETLDRRGKYLIVQLDDGAALLVHLRMTGNLLWLAEPPEVAPRFLRARALLDDGSYLAYTDARRFGTWRVAEDGAEAYLAGKLGPEPLGDWKAADLRVR